MATFPSTFPTGAVATDGEPAARSGFWSAGHRPTLLAAFLYFDLAFMVWVLLGPLAPDIARELGLNPAERGLMLTRGILEVLVERHNPFTILTKSTLALRDVDLFAEAASHSQVSVSFSIGTIDSDVWRQTEPGTPHPQRRIEAIARLHEAGVPTGVRVAPLIPGLSDRPQQVAAVEAACREAGAGSISMIRLHLRPGVKQHFMGWLGEHHPELTADYERLFRDRAYLPRHPQGRARPKPTVRDAAAQPALPFG